MLRSLLADRLQNQIKFKSSLSPEDPIINPQLMGFWGFGVLGFWEGEKGGF